MPRPAVPTLVQRCRAGLVAALLAGVAPAQAARLEAPSVYLAHDHHVLVAGVVDGWVDGTLRLADVERLRGIDDAPEVLAVRAPAWLGTSLERGQRVLVAYSEYTRDPRHGDTVIVDERGARMLAYPGLEPAVFGDTPAARAELLDASADAAKRARAIAALAGPDRQWQNFHAHEIALRTGWHADRAVRRAVAALVRDRDAHPSARAVLLRTAASPDASLGRGWWADAALTIVTETATTPPARGDDTTADLVRTAFEALAIADRAVPRASLARWVASENAALAEQALLAARRAAPDSERPLAEAALASSLLSNDMRLFLRDHLRRLAFMREAQAVARQ